MIKLPKNPPAAAGKVKADENISAKTLGRAEMLVTITKTDNKIYTAHANGIAAEVKAETPECPFIIIRKTTAARITPQTIALTPKMLSKHSDAARICIIFPSVNEVKMHRRAKRFLKKGERM